MKKNMIWVGFLVLLTCGAAIAANQIATLRGNTALDDQGKASVMAPVINEDQKIRRDYPMQPPIVPHTIDGYQVDLNSNKCLSCHARKRVEESLAPMVSVTHYMDRNGNFLADISPRRYFCSQCHVTQDKVKPLIANQFKDIDDLLKAQQDQ